MTLWNIIRDFFVQYVFGGVLSSGSQINSNIMGRGYISNNSWTLANTSVVFNVGRYSSDLNETVYTTMGDWLSTTATIITLIIICVLIGFFVRWLFRLTSGLIQGRG